MTNGSKTSGARTDGPLTTKIRNRFPSCCLGCGLHLPPDSGYLLPKEDGGSWRILCDRCLTAAIKVPSFLVALGLTPPVTVDDIKAAFRRKVFGVHPDHGGEASEFVRLRSSCEQALSYAAAGRRRP